MSELLVLKDRKTGIISTVKNKQPLPDGFIDSLKVSDWERKNLSNFGVEFSINADIVQQDNFTWNIGFNATYLENEIKKLNTIDDPSSPGLATGGISGGVGNTIQTQKVGEAQNSFLVYKQVYDSNGNPLDGVYVDRDQDGKFTDADKYVFHSPNPDYLLGFSSYMNYMNFDLNFTMRASIGNYAYNNIAAKSSVTNLNDLGTNRNVHNSILETNFQEVQLWSDHYIQDASFLKMDNIVLGYNFDNIN